MSDIADQAQAYEALFLGEALRRQRVRSAAARGRTSSAICIDCDAEIPPARRAAIAGAQRCTECEEIKARTGRLKGEK